MFVQGKIPGQIIDGNDDVLLYSIFEAKYVSLQGGTIQPMNLNTPNPTPSASVQPKPRGCHGDRPPVATYSIAG